MDLKLKNFKDINLNDPFFDSLKQDYSEFPHWFMRKSEDSAYVFEDSAGNVNGFLYLKLENEPISSTTPQIPASPRLKVGTMKINAHGTKLGERFLKKIFDHALHYAVPEIYVTIFAKHESLIHLYEKYGFTKIATKASSNGSELVLSKSFNHVSNHILQDYPRIDLKRGNVYLLSLKPEWHTRLLPDSILKTETSDIIEDVSHTNSIHKVYLTNMRGTERLQAGDALLIYRTTDGQGPAHYRSVATSVGVVEEYRNINSFTSRQEFMEYCKPYSVFSEDELSIFWARKNYPHVFRFTYNAALKRRVTRGAMIEKFGLDPNAYWGFMPLSKQQLKAITQAGQLNESIIID